VVGGREGHDREGAVFVVCHRLRDVRGITL